MEKRKRVNKRVAPTRARLSNALRRWQTFVIVTLGFVVPVNAFLFFFSYLPSRTTAAVSSEDTAPKTTLESIGSTTATPRLPPGYSLELVDTPSGIVLGRSADPSIIALRRSDGTVVARFSRLADPEQIRRAAEEDLRPIGNKPLEYEESIRKMSNLWVALLLAGGSLAVSVATLVIAWRVLESVDRSERAGDERLEMLREQHEHLKLMYQQRRLLLEQLERQHSEREDRLREEHPQEDEREEAAEQPFERSLEQPGGDLEATNAAKRKAEELGVDLSWVKGSGPNGRITTLDVLSAATIRGM